MKLILNLVLTDAMPNTPEGLMAFESSQHDEMMRQLARAIRNHQALLATKGVERKLTEYAESVFFDTLKIEQDSESEEIFGSTLSLDDDINDNALMERFTDDAQQFVKDVGSLAKYGALLVWRNGAATVTYVEIQQ